MPNATFSVLLAISVASFGLSGKRALELRALEKYRTSWGAWFWAFFPGLVSAMILTTDGGTDVSARNYVLGLLGAIVGICGAIYLGYVVTDWRAHAQTPNNGGGNAMREPVKPQLPPITSNSGIIAPGDSAINAPHNSGIIAPNNSGTINQNQAPPPKLVVRDCKREQMANGSFRWICELTIEYAGIVPKFTVIPRGLDVAIVTMESSSGVTTGAEDGRLNDGRSYASCTNASGSYSVTLIRREDLPPVLDYSFK
jgi:hypothetical protein